MHIFRRITIASSVLISFLLAVPSVALAKANEQAIPGESNLGFLLAGFGIAWAVFFIYVLYLAKRTREVGKEIEEIHRKLATRD